MKSPDIFLNTAFKSWRLVYLFIVQVLGLRSRDVNVVMHESFPQRFNAIVGDISKYKKVQKYFIM